MPILPYSLSCPQRLSLSLSLSLSLFLLLDIRRVVCRRGHDVMNKYNPESERARERERESSAMHRVTLRGRVEWRTGRP